MTELIFDKIDKIKFSVLGYDLTSLLRPDGWRKYSLLLITFSGLAWIFFGYDGCFDQIEWGATALFEGASWASALGVMESRYGIATHFSAAVIYGFMFYALSKHLEKIGIKKSLNLSLSIAATVFAISLFEFTWMGSYYWSQQQFWVLKPLTTQASILYQNLGFAFAGVMAIPFVLASPYRFKINKKFGILLLLTLGLWASWYYYPLPTQAQASGFKVELVDGTFFTPSNNFPQTLYTIDHNPWDDDAVGVPYFVEDNAVHTWNTVFKVVFAYAVFYGFSLRKVKIREEVSNQKG